MKLSEFKDVEELIKLFESSSLSSLDIKIGSDSLCVKKPGAEVYPAVNGIPAAQVGADRQEAAKAEESDDSHKVKSPLAGVFYSAPSPDDSPFVKVGDKVKKGDILCIVEAMKVMNEINADCDGQIKEISAHDGQIVEYGQPLFTIA